VVDARERALELSARYDEEVRRLLPLEADIFDAHLHLGRDIDGMIGDYDELEALMARYGVSRAFAFCLDEPDRHPAFSAANDRTLAYAARSNGRLIPFVRLDLNERPLAEARRCLDAGARGIKLHPRAQSFDATDARLGPVFELAAERGVPILIHGGRGLPPVSAGLAALVERNPEAALIIAHAGIADMAALSAAMAGRKRVYFDTSVWSPIDLLELYRRVPAEQILYASDYPYGQQPASLLIAVLTAQRAGYDEQRLRDLLAGNARRLAEGADTPEPTRPFGQATFEQPLSFARIHQYLTMAISILWLRQPDSVGVLALALNACSDDDGHAEELARIRELLEAAQALWLALAELDDPDERLIAGRLAARLLHLADIEALTAH
jgi:predicted TIM-barrel fold metal-dependent hydrolase